MGRTCRRPRELTAGARPRSGPPGVLPRLCLTPRLAPSAFPSGGMLPRRKQRSAQEMSGVYAGCLSQRTWWNKDRRRACLHVCPSWWVSIATHVWVHMYLSSCIYLLVCLNLRVFVFLCALVHMYLKCPPAHVSTGWWQEATLLSEVSSGFLWEAYFYPGI